MYINIIVDIQPTVTRSFRSITILEGETVTLSCSPSIIELTLNWLHNGKDITAGGISFSPPVFNHNLTIENALLIHSGVYTCIAAVNGLTAEQNISVMIVPGTYTAYTHNNTNGSV